VYDLAGTVQDEIWQQLVYGALEVTALQLQYADALLARRAKFLQLRRKEQEASVAGTERHHVLPKP